ncbi:hypothetical protein H4W81_003907 [Nonomuraea africana]|uniref:Uncharacterized protein n=1 Tax=Nonomuraea africana TaxID=46171 RepID=A0ABR9KGI9_9ACTN|nr:hypothetical protein [Nonomuraea africana]
MVLAHAVDEEPDTYDQDAVDEEPDTDQDACSCDPES